MIKGFYIMLIMYNEPLRRYTDISTKPPKSIDLGFKLTCARPFGLLGLSPPIGRESENRPTNTNKTLKESVPPPHPSTKNQKNGPTTSKHFQGTCKMETDRQTGRQTDRHQHSTQRSADISDQCSTTIHGSMITQRGPYSNTLQYIAIYRYPWELW